MRFGVAATVWSSAMLAACARTDAGTSDGSVDGADLAGAAPRDLATSTGDLAAPFPATLDGNRDRLLAGVRDLWTRLDPSSRAVFLTRSARMGGSQLGSDGSTMLAHITRVYRVVGGQNAGATAPGSCGGGDYNRMIVSMDGALHGALVAGGAFDLADVLADATRFWRDSHDLGDPHAPFDLSDETNDGAPRG